MRTLLCALVALLIAGPAGATPLDAPDTEAPLDLWLTVGGALGDRFIYGAERPLLYDYEGVGFAYDRDLVSLGFDFVLNNDQKYEPSEPHMRGRYFDLLDGHVELSGERLSATGGRVVHRDEVDGPYSLFVSSAPNPTTLLNLRYDDGFFFYESRWLELNRQSSLYTYEVPVVDSEHSDPECECPECECPVIEMPLDRGAVYKAYGVDFGRLRVGLQESVVYLYTTFYPEYFLSPLPMYFTQLVNSTSGKPWTQRANENSLMGIFAEYEWEEASVFGQFLIDDWNEMGIDWLAPGEWNNPAKFAWYLGGDLDLGVGTLGLYHAGATKYTFESTYAGDRADGFRDYNPYPYSYTYYPVTEYTRDGDVMPILPADNYIGYLHGENNIAFMTTFSSEARGVAYDASLEYAISGTKAPTNPWHEADWHSQQGTELLNDDALEHRLVFDTTAYRW
ncbi:MAG: hypothetical protein ACOCVO_02120, partial [bacterium]